MKRFLSFICSLTFATSVFAREGVSNDPVLAENDFSPIAAADQLRAGEPVTANAVGGPWQNDPPCPDLDCSGGGGAMCVVPDGYSAGCGYNASSEGGNCNCVEGEDPTTLCMKTTAGGSCGLHESPNDPCCQARSGF